MLGAESSLKELVERVPQRGRVTWIGRAAEHRGPMQALEEVRIEVGTGLVGEHHAPRGGGKRQVTLVQAEHIDAVSSILGRTVVPADLRRNIAVAGLNMMSLKKRRFRLGEALLEYTGRCEPCSRIEENLGEGGYQALRGHGGICARVLEPGLVRIRDAVFVDE